MTNLRNTKRALLSSVIALFVCFSMLLGTTFAWFTDSVTSTGNIIQSGTLEVTMEWAEGTTDPANTTWTDASTGAIFNNKLWEPGHVEVRHIKISNEGTLALKYQVSIMANGAVSELADVIDVYYVDPAVQVEERTDLVEEAKLGTLTQVLAGMSDTASGNLLAGENHTVTLALKMQETAGNEYKGLSIGTDFSIQLLATQYTYEPDDFDDQYDADATFGTYIELNAGDDLLAALASAKADMPVTVKLNGDVEWPTEGHHGENDITPASSIIIEGNGYTITATGSGVTPLGDVEAPMTLKNVKIVDNSVSYAENAWEFTYLEMGGTALTCNNVTFADEIQLGTNATFTNCSFESNEESVYAVWVEDGSATFTNCTFTGYRGLKMHEDYGTEINKVTVKNCTFSNLTKKPGIALGTLNADTTVSITGSSFINCQAGDQGLYIYETDTDVTTFNFIEENNTVSPDVWNGTADTSWYNDTDTEFTLTSAEAVAGLASLVDGGNNFAGKTIKLDADINLYIEDANGEPISFEPIGSFSDNTAFEGTFDGQGHTISNLYQNGWALQNGYWDGPEYGMGFFSLVENASIKNINFDGASLPSEANIMGVVAGGAANCVFENISVTNAYLGNHSWYSGGLLGWAEGDVKLINCDIDESSVVSSQWGDFNNANGGLIGGIDPSSTIYLKDCDVACVIDAYNDVTSAYEWYSYRSCGMLIGDSGQLDDPDGNNVGNAIAPNLICENVTVTYGDWANYHYCEFGSSGYPFCRVEAGESTGAYGNARVGEYYDANGNKVVDDNHVHNDGEKHNELIVFDQLYGGESGDRYCTYGTATHEGVTVIYNNK